MGALQGIFISRRLTILLEIIALDLVWFGISLFKHVLLKALINLIFKDI